MMPTPNHLKGLVVRDDTEFDEEPLVAPVRCPCGGRGIPGTLVPGTLPELSPTNRQTRVGVVEETAPDYIYTSESRRL
jgi:hypothetical protein